MNNAQLVGIWRNAVRLTDSKQKGAAIRAIKAIEKEWKCRAAAGIDSSDHFAWPTTNASGGDGQLSLESQLKEGMLKYLEYQVGRTNGQAPIVRQAILRRVFEGVLPPAFPPDYMAQWAAPGTAARLRKLAETLAALARNFKRQHDSRFDDAIADREADLRFLYDEYYIGRFAFAWPSASI